MTIFFTPDIVAYGDRIGFGWWLMSHSLEHGVFSSMGATHSPRYSVPVFDLTGWTWTDPKVITDWLDVHEDIHNVLRGALNIEGFDLSAVDVNNREDFTIWMDSHAAEHGAIRAVLGILS